MTLSERDEWEWQDLVRRMEEPSEPANQPTPDTRLAQRIADYRRRWWMFFTIYVVAAAVGSLVVGGAMALGWPLVVAIFTGGAVGACLGGAVCVWRLRLPPRLTRQMPSEPTDR